MRLRLLGDSIAAGVGSTRREDTLGPLLADRLRKAGHEVELRVHAVPGARSADLDAQVRAAAWEARRLVDPNTPPPDQLEITPQIHAGIVAKLYAAAFPSEAAAPGAGGGAGQASPAATARPVAPAEEDAAGRLKVGRLPRFYVKGDYAKGASAAGSGPSAPPASGSGAAGTDRPKEGTADTADTRAPAIALDEMEAKLAARIEIPPAELQAVGEARALAIRAWLVETGKVAPERVLLTPVAATGMRVNLNLK